MFIRKRTYLDLKEQNERLDRIAYDAVEQNGRLLDEVRQSHIDFKRFVDEYRTFQETFGELRHSYETLQENYDMMAARNQEMEDTIAEQEEIIGNMTTHIDQLVVKERAYDELMVERNYLYAKCKYYAKLLGIDDDRLDTIITSGEVEQ